MTAPTAPGSPGLPTAPAADTFVTGPDGLSTAEVAQRVARGQTNEADDRTSRTVVQIVRANVFTRFNAILGVMLAVVFALGDYRDGLFGVILVSNSAIGIAQELYSKRTLDRLAVLNAPGARVVRDGKVLEIPVEAVVLDDLVEVRAGDQVPADGVVRSSNGLQVDESLLTGESDPVDKPAGSALMSGSIVVSGSGRFQATAVGNDAYARKLAAGVKEFSPARSELRDGIDTLLRYITYAIVPISGLLLWSQLASQGASVRSALIATVAGVVGMVPQGLVLLTSGAFAIAAIKLARRKVLVQELVAVEGLARVDVVCLDKTGTLTEGRISFDRAVLLDGHSSDEATVQAALGALADDPSPNATTEALAAAIPRPDGWPRVASVAFSSKRKWSAATFEGHGTWVMGAPEMVLPEAPEDDPTRTEANELAAGGERVLLLARTDARLAGDTLPTDLVPVALVLFEEQIRPDAKDTLAYFRAQGVSLKVISGDNPRTVGAVARRVGLDAAGEPVDARELPDDEAELGAILEDHSVFGRVTPQQKRLMVKALQARGHVVAMTGDGVNDALALKDADIGVAMGSGAAATRAVAQLVLLDGKFAKLPGVVAEGRRVIANIERVANLFVTKTVWAMLLAVLIVCSRVFASGWAYPLLPRHLTLIDTVTIGVPSFFLALAPNTRRYIPGFLRRVLEFAVPAGLVAGTAAFLAYALARWDLITGHRSAHLRTITNLETKTAATIVLMIVGLWILVLLARPFTRWRAILVGCAAGFGALALVVPAIADYFALRLPPAAVLVQTVAIGVAAAAVIECGYRAVRIRNRVRGRHRRGDAADVGDDGVDVTGEVTASPDA
ncbi:MAG: ATPase, P-type (transporting), superfamily, subfamily [Actinomycetia bacterium]|nr:ATPase, P-type (transporting), superfamily, subfamily [Actinomycetes bacterium]